MSQTTCEDRKSNQTSLPAAEGQNLGPENKQAKKLITSKSSSLGSSFFPEVASDRLPTREPSAEVAHMLNSVEPSAEFAPELQAFWECEEVLSMIDGVEPSRFRF